MTVSGLFNGQSKTIEVAAGILFLSSFISGILGFLRNGLLSWRFGASEATDMYLAAFRIPDLLYGVLIMGGVSSIFLPLFAEHMARNQQEAWRFVSKLLNVVLTILLGLALLVFLFAPSLIPLITPGFTIAQIETTANLTRLMLLSPLLFGISAIFSGVLHYFQRFAAYAAAPVLYNLGIIFGILFLAPLWGIWGVAVGVVVGACFHVLVQAPQVWKAGFAWQPFWGFGDVAIKKAMLLAFPRTLAAAGLYLNLIVITAIASLLGEGSITMFEYANQVQQLPVGLIGTSFALASFPVLSKLAADRNLAKLSASFSQTAARILFFVLPLAVFILLLRAQTVRLIFGTGGKFGWDETRLTAAVLGIFAFGIIFYAFLPLLSRTFFALQDTKTPTATSISSVLVNIGAAVFFVKLLSSSNMFSEFLISSLKLQGISDIRLLALPLAFVIAGIFQTVLLSVLLSRVLGEMFKREFFVSAGKTIAASLVAGITTYGVLQLYGRPFPLETYVRVLTQFLLAGFAGTFAFAVCALLLKSAEMVYITKTIQRILYGRKH